MRPDKTDKENAGLDDKKEEGSSKVPSQHPSRSPAAARRHGTNHVGFKVDIMLDGVQRCLQDEGIFVDAYLDMYAELRRAFEAAGTVFSFVATEVHEKVYILRNFRKGKDRERYATVASTLQDLRDRPDQKQPSAARTLLRLHRAVPFLSGTFRCLATTDREDRMGLHGRQVYKDTLAKHHPKLVQQTICAVMYLSPKNNYIIKRLVGNDPATQDHLLTTIPVLCDRLNQLFEATEKLYAKYDMMDLP